MKNIITIVLVALIAIGGITYFKYYHPQSQLQLKLAFQRVIAIPIEKYYNSNVSSCGIWYSHHADGNDVMGRSNSTVLRCMEKAHSRCIPKKILIVDDFSSTEQSSIIYSNLEILRGNDAGDCLMQNSYEQQYLTTGVEIEPMFFINTCTTLDENMQRSCEPKYITDKKKN
jgi:hypothetical protein